MGLLTKLMASFASFVTRLLLFLRHPPFLTTPTRTQYFEAFFSFGLKAILETYPPILESPQPPGQALTYDGSARRATGLNVPVLKYGPTGDRITYKRAEEDLFTPRVGCWIKQHDKRNKIVKAECQFLMKERKQICSTEKLIGATTLAICLGTLCSNCDLLASFEKCSFLTPLPPVQC